MKRYLLVLALLIFSFDASAILFCANDTYSEHGYWYVGQPGSVLDQIDTEGDVWCQASGAELVYIQHNFAGLRMRVGKNTQGYSIVTWQNEDAAFILDNL